MLVKYYNPDFDSPPRKKGRNALINTGFAALVHRHKFVGE
ncbi:MAG: hypothetical protein FD169_2476, partial [Bacillota bacterium]